MLLSLPSHQPFYKTRELLFGNDGIEKRRKIWQDRLRVWRSIQISYILLRVALF